MIETTHVRGWFEPAHLGVSLGEPFALELVVRNEGPSDAFVFVSPAVEIDVLEGGHHDVDAPRMEPDGGLVAERRLRPGGAYRQEMPLSRWLTFREPGQYVVECRIRVDTSDRSIGEDGGTAVAVDVASRIELNVSSEEAQR